MKKTTQQLYCHKCGELLSDDNCRKAKNSLSGYSHLCLSCEQELFNTLSATQGRPFGLFYTCAATDTPCFPMVLESCMDEFQDEKSDGWIIYVNTLEESGENRKLGKLLGFDDGLTDIRAIFGKNLSQEDFVAYIAHEKNKQSRLCGSKLQRERWGTLPIYKGLNWTNELYDELDRLYSIRESAYKGQDLTSQQTATLIKVAKNDAIYDHLMRTGLAKLATDIQKSTSQLLADENMRPKDKKPVEELRLDALVLALEEAGLMENGDLLNYDELIEVLRDRFVKSKKYDYSLDVADQMMLDIINSMRYNADLPYIQDLPEEFAPVDEYGEFEPEETEREKENKRFLGITKVNIVKSDKGENQ